MNGYFSSLSTQLEPMRLVSSMQNPKGNVLMFRVMFNFLLGVCDQPLCADML